MGGSEFKQRLQLLNESVVAAADFAKDEDLDAFVTSPLMPDLHEQLKYVRNAITTVKMCKKKINATIKKYYSEKP